MAVDCNGYITLPKYKEIQPEYSGMVEEVITKLISNFPDLVHSLYVYGSVATGQARLGKSDLDLTVIFNSEPNQITTDKLLVIQSELEKNNPIVSKIDFDCGVLPQVLDLKSIFSWGYWLKHHCVCVYGENLSLKFSPFKPSKAIAIAVNGDFLQILEKLTAKMRKTQDAKEQILLQRAVARKIIRSTNILRSDEDNDWPETLLEYRSRFNSRYPSLATDIDYFLEISSEPQGNIAEFIKRVKSFTYWLNTEFINQTD